MCLLSCSHLVVVDANEIDSDPFLSLTLARSLSFHLRASRFRRPNRYVVNSGRVKFYMRAYGSAASERVPGFVYTRIHLCVGLYVCVWSVFKG